MCPLGTQSHPKEKVQYSQSMTSFVVVCRYPQGAFLLCCTSSTCFLGPPIWGLHATSISSGKTHNTFFFLLKEDCSYIGILLIFSRFELLHTVTRRETYNNGYILGVSAVIHHPWTCVHLFGKGELILVIQLMRRPLE